jgi:thioredoxin reductase (NADPH)
MEEANFLTRFCTKVTLVHRRDEFRASKIMLDRAHKNPKIAFMTNTSLKSYLGDPKAGGLTGARIVDTATNKERDVATQGIFLAIGHVPNTQLFVGQLDLDPKGYIQVKAGSSLTKIPGTFACGDVQDSYYRQAVTAAGSGCMAAIDAERFLESEGH